MKKLLPDLSKNIIYGNSLIGRDISDGQLFAGDEMVAKVDAMLEAKKRWAHAKTDKDKTYYKNKCAALEGQIDRIVFDLYGLTDKEIQIVEQHC